MMHPAYLLTLVSAAAVGSLVDAIWKGMLLACCVAVCLRMVPGISAAVRSTLWTVVFLLVVLLHIGHPFGLVPAATLPLSNRTIHVDLRWSLAIACIWAIFSLVRVAQLVQSAVRLRRMARRALSVVPSTACAALLRTRFRSAQLCTSNDVDRPSVIGFFRPRILFPRALFEKLSTLELEQIVLHEMEHLRRADDWINLVQKFALALFPLNPVLFWIERRLCVERELACDDQVLLSTRARKAYATCLVNLAEHSVLHRGASLVLGAWERQSELGFRVRRILWQPAEGMGRSCMRFVMGALSFGILLGAVVLAREPQHISFVPVLPAQAQTLLPAAYGPGQVRTDFRATAPPPTLVNVNAVLPPAGKPASGLPIKPLHRNPAVRRVSLRHASSDRETRMESWIVLTGWDESEMPAQMRSVQIRLAQMPMDRMQVLASSNTQSSYTAVSVANGWLIVQL